MGRRLEELRLLLSFHAESVGLGIGLATTAVLCALALLVYLPLGSRTAVFGVVDGFNLREFETGSKTYVQVRLHGREHLVRLNTRTNCRIGDAIGLEKTPYLLGARLEVRDKQPICGRLIHAKRDAAAHAVRS